MQQDSKQADGFEFAHMDPPKPPQDLIRSRRSNNQTMQQHRHPAVQADGSEFADMEPPMPPMPPIPPIPPHDLIPGICKSRIHGFRVHADDQTMQQDRHRHKADPGDESEFADTWDVESPLPPMPPMPPMPQQDLCVRFSDDLTMQDSKADPESPGDESELADTWDVEPPHPPQDLIRNRLPRMQPSDNQKMQQDSQQPLQADGSEFADIEPPMPMQDLICSICMEVLRNPDMRLVCGGHVYCRRCIRARKNTGGSGGGGVGSGGSGGGVPRAESP
jgi:hypothetical protein